MYFRKVTLLRSCRTDVCRVWQSDEWRNLPVSFKCLSKWLVALSSIRLSQNGWTSEKEKEREELSKRGTGREREKGEGDCCHPYARASPGFCLSCVRRGRCSLEASAARYAFVIRALSIWYTHINLWKEKSKMRPELSSPHWNRMYTPLLWDRDNTTHLTSYRFINVLY